MGPRRQMKGSAIFARPFFGRGELLGAAPGPAEGQQRRFPVEQKRIAVGCVLPFLLCSSTVAGPGFPAAAVGPK